MPDFAASIDAWCDQVEERADQAFRGIAEASLARVKELTPVDTGFLRANWAVVPGDVSLPVVGRGQERDAAQSEQALAAALERAKAGEVLKIVNPVVYARAVEYGREIERKDGTTVRIEGRFMLTRTVAELPELARQVIADLNGMGGRVR